MKRLLLVLLILVPLVLLSVWLAKRPAPLWNVKTTMTFLGFTNAVAGAPPGTAHFGFNAVSSGPEFWHTLQVGQFDGTDWVFRKETSWNFGFFPPGGNSNEGPTTYVLRGAVRVGSTSAPTRVVICATRGPSGPIEEFWAAAKWKVAQALGRQDFERVIFTGPQYFMTNDFNFTSSTPPPP